MGLEQESDLWAYPQQAHRKFEVVFPGKLVQKGLHHLLGLFFLGRGVATTAAGQALAATFLATIGINPVNTLSGCFYSHTWSQSNFSGLLMPRV